LQAEASDVHEPVSITGASNPPPESLAPEDEADPDEEADPDDDAEPDELLVASLPPSCELGAGLPPLLLELQP
jgi:hypothetical protein